MMTASDCGALPVGENDRLIGMITDRDIAIRAVAVGKGPDSLVGDVMSKEICYCFADQDLGEITANMGDTKVRRLPVVDRNKRLVGIVSLGDIARADGTTARRPRRCPDFRKKAGRTRRPSPGGAAATV